MAGIKYDSEKLRYHLIDRAANAWLAAVLTYGATKYSVRGVCTCRVADAVERNSTSNASVSVDPATTKSCEDATPSTLNGNERTLAPGQRNTPDALPNSRHSGEHQEHQSNARQLACGGSTGSPSKPIAPSSPTVVESVRPPSACASTTTTSPERSEAASVIPATSGSGSSSVPTTGSIEHSPTCEWHKITSGEENWRQVEGWRDRYYDALMRHVEAWRGGEQYDPESSLPHLCHALFCTMCLLGMDSPDLRELPERLAYAMRVAKTFRDR